MVEFSLELEFLHPPVLERVRVVLPPGVDPQPRRRQQMGLQLAGKEDVTVRRPHRCTGKARVLLGNQLPLLKVIDVSPAKQVIRIDLHIRTPRGQRLEHLLAALAVPWHNVGERVLHRVATGVEPSLVLPLEKAVDRRPRRHVRRVEEEDRDASVLVQLHVSAYFQCQRRAEGVSREPDDGVVTDDFEKALDRQMRPLESRAGGQRVEQHLQVMHQI